MDIEKIISEMTLEEKISYCTGADFWHTKTMPQYGLPAIKMSDGPHGLRCQTDEADMIGVNEALPATCFPAAVTAGATWNEELYKKEGEAIGKEAVGKGVSVVLGPGCNIKRNPLAGRNFEYLSEDPYLAGKMAAAFIGGQQSTGASSSLKHFAANSQEYKRQNGDSQIDERTLREIYLQAFEIAVKEGKPDTVMCAYNKLNGIHCSDNKKLLTDILREEWGFNGMVVTDWGALNDRIAGFEAGCDLNMPGGSKFMERVTLQAVKNGQLDEKKIDDSVRRILKLVEKAEKIKTTENGKMADDSVKSREQIEEEHHLLAQRIAEQGAVLLKNEDQILPLNEEDVVLVGYMAEHMRYQGSGSSHINPTRLVNLTDAFSDVPYIACCDKEGNVTKEALTKTVEEVKKHKIAVVVTGLTESYESEALDREHMRLPEGMNQMVKAVAAANPNTVVVLLGGSVMELPWADQVRAILYMGMSGQAGGQAAYNLLTGRVNPCGKLTESWPITYEDVISKETFGKRNVEYREGIYVGYRYYDKAGKKVRYPFGYGLSYTTFLYEEMKIKENTVTVKIKNTGKTAGAEVVQLYVAPPQDGVFRPQKELKGFSRVELAPGESRMVQMTLTDRSFAIWQDGWKIPSGEYQIMIGSSSRDIHLTGSISISGEQIEKPNWQKTSWYETLDGSPKREEWEKLMGNPIPFVQEPKKGEYTLDNTCLEMKESSLIMKIQYKVTENIVAKSYGGKKDLSNPAYRMTLTCAVDCPLRATVINGGGAMTDSLANGLLLMANGHFFKGILAMLKK